VSRSIKSEAILRDEAAEREALRWYVKSELEKPPGDLARRDRFHREKLLWWSASEIAKQRRVPLHMLRQMREAGVGPLWRPRGHEILYHVTEFDTWKAACPKLIEPELPPSLVQWFIGTTRHHPLHWVLCTSVTSSFEAWCIGKLGSLPTGCRRELWRQIKADGRFTFTRPRVEKHERVRLLLANLDEPLGRAPTQVRALLGWGYSRHLD
jgi:hypothetical protein